MSVQALVERLKIAADNGTLTSEGVQEIFNKNYNPISRKVLQYIRENKGSALANDNISKVLEKLEVNPKDLESEIAGSFGELLHAMIIDHTKDHNSDGTPDRYARMVLHDTLDGRYYPAPKITEFQNVRNADQLISHFNLGVNSLCSHHHQNIIGKCHIGVLPRPDGTVLGFSKYSRIVRYVSHRPQIQEEMTVQIAEEIEKAMKPLGIAVVIDAEHQCMTCRGVRESGSIARTTHLVGDFMEIPHLKAEFMEALPRIT